RTVARARARQEHHRGRARRSGKRCAKRGGRPRRRRGEDHLQLLGGAPRDASRRDGAHLESGRRVALRALFPPYLGSKGNHGLPLVMKILLWHGYLLGGTGSNVYTRALAREWSRMGHEVVVVCQERHPERYDLEGASVVVPELPQGLLPVFVLDAYDGLHAKLLQEFTPHEP